MRRVGPDVACFTRASCSCLRDFLVLFVLASRGVLTVVHLHAGTLAGFVGVSRFLSPVLIHLFAKLRLAGKPL